MRTIKCDKCEYGHIFTSEGDTFNEIRRKKINIIIGSGRASDEPEQRVEHEFGNIDLCLNCQKDLKRIYDEATIAAFVVISKWLHPRDGYICDKCGYVDYQYYDHKFCPNCGADMRKGAEE